MPKFSVALMGYDVPDRADGTKNAKQGDILDFFPYPHEWGAEEVKHCLIITVDNISLETMKQFVEEEWDNGKLVSEMTDEERMVRKRGTTGKKRRYFIPRDTLLSKFSALDFNKIEDKRDTYQPVSETTIDLVKEKSFVKDAKLDSFVDTTKGL